MNDVMILVTSHVNSFDNVTSWFNVAVKTLMIGWSLEELLVSTPVLRRYTV